MDLINMISGIADGSLERIKKSDPAKHRKMIEFALSLFDIGIMMMKDSPEVRQAFARIHAEFLKYPECRETIEQAYIAKNDFAEDINLGSVNILH